MSEQAVATPTRQAAAAEPGTKPGLMLQRKCACGQHTVAGGECAACQKKRLAVQRWPARQPRPDPTARPAGAHTARGMDETSGTDLSRVSATTPVLRTTPRLQRMAEDGALGDSAAPATEPALAPESPAPAPENAPPAEESVHGSEPEAGPASESESTGDALLVEDGAGALQPGQMEKAEFLEQLQSAVCAEAEAALAGTGRSTEGCPYLAFWFGFYRGQSADYVERALRRYVPEAAGAASAAAYIPLVAARVRQGVERWAATGEVTGVPEDAPQPATASAEVPQPGAAADAGAVQLKEREGETGAPADDPAAVQARLGAGQPLDGGVRARMEGAFGRSFSGVRLHTGATAGRLSTEQRARAFTVGSHVAFGAGEYRPGTVVGDALIAHELAHVVQQGSGQASVEAMDGSAGYGAMEQDADRSAAGVVASLWGGAKGALAGMAGRAVPSLRSGLRIQRCKSDPPKQEAAPAKDATAPPAAAETITSETVVTSPGLRTRTTIGVGEEVNLTHAPGTVTWSTTAGTLSATTGTTVIVTAPDTAQAITVTAGTVTKDFTVIAPTTVAMDREPGTGVKHLKDRADSGILTRVFLGPDTVNFSGARYRELNVPGVPTTPGAYSCNPASGGHCPGAVGGACDDKSLTNTVVANMGTQSLLGDCAYSGYCLGGSSFLPGSLTLNIPYEYRVGAGSFHAFTTVAQVHTLAPMVSTLTTGKAGARGTTTVAADRVDIAQCPYPASTP
jgi:hypothetical protein